MNVIFYTDAKTFSSTDEALLNIAKKFLQLSNVNIMRGDHGKPFFQAEDFAVPFFSVSHTDERLFIAVSKNNVGIDAEKIARKVDYQTIIKRFSIQERKEITDLNSFLSHWTVKESAVKWLGGSLALDLYKLRYEQNKLYYTALELPVKIFQKTIDNHLVSICCEDDFSNAEIIKL